MRKGALLLAFIAVLLATRNLPWHLDDYDQAKQAFTSYEMIGQGQWWFQHTPTGGIATKPPLTGWISALLYLATGGLSWNLAWRLPSFVCALALIAMLWKAGRTIAGGIGAGIAVAAFALNLMTPRLATLVRTDMMLTFFIFVAGWLILEKVRAGEPWTPRERWLLFATVLASLLTKGPIAYVFLLPGLVAYLWIARRRDWPRVAWPGWWPWVSPLLLFGVWVMVGIMKSEQFYEKVVLHEFLGRFTTGEQAVHRNHPVWFYAASAARDWFPCVAGLIGVLLVKRVRAALRSEPALLWLALWAAGGFVVMSLVPSKRKDRVHPVLPPAVLLLAGLAARAGANDPGRLRRITGAAIIASALVSGGYAAFNIARNSHRDAGGLVRFGAMVRELTAAHPGRLALVNGKDEGLLIYTRSDRFTPFDKVGDLWRTGRIDWVLASPAKLQDHESSFPGSERLAELPRLEGKSSGYILLGRRAGGAPETGP
jgi:4-amino-4-deoxy-L-arabinose transferase-like glycosyltransferase